MTGTLFRVWLVSVKRKMACWNKNVLLMDQSAALDGSWITLTHMSFVPSAKHYQLHGTTGPGHQNLYGRVLKACSTFFVPRNRNEPAKDIKKLNILNVMHGVPVAWKFIMCTVLQNCFAKYSFSTGISVNTSNDEENCEWLELKGHIGCPITFDKFLNVDKSLLTTGD